MSPLPGFGQGGNGAGDFANILNMISSGWGNQVTPFDIGLDLGPQQVGQAYQQGQSALNDRMKRELAMAQIAAENQRHLNQNETQLGIADMGNQLGYAKLGSAEKVANIGQEGRVGAAQARGSFDIQKFLMGEQGKNQRAAQELGVKQERNKIMDKPPAWKPDPMLEMEIQNRAKKMVADSIAAKQPISPEDAYAAVRNSYQAAIAGGAGQAKQAYQGAAPPQAQPQQQAAPQQAPPRPSDYRPIHERLLGLNNGQYFDTAPQWY